MSWNYRIIDHGDHLALHEVHYGKDGAPGSYTTTPATFVADPEEGPDGITGGLKMAFSDAALRPILTLTDFEHPGGKMAEGKVEAVEAIYLDGERVEPIRLREFDAARHLTDPESARYYIEAAMEGGDDRHLLGALKDVLRSGALEKPRVDEDEPEIVIRWSRDDQAWLASVSMEGVPVPGTAADGRTPTLALDALMEKRFLLGSDLF